MSKVNTLFIGLGVHKETTDMAWVSDKPAYEVGPGKHGHVVKPHAALFERVARSSAVDLARQSPMLPLHFMLLAASYNLSILHKNQMHTVDWLFYGVIWQLLKTLKIVKRLFWPGSGIYEI